MRPAPPPGGLALALVPALACVAAAGPPPPDVRVVARDGAEVRCQPAEGDRCYVTDVLRKGARVTVLGEKPGGWLEVKPPPGAFSWVNTRFVRQTSANYCNLVVDPPDGKDVPVRIGSRVVDGLPQVVGCSLPRGSQVRRIGPAQTSKDGAATESWLPIVPPDREVRYLRAEALVAPAAPARPPAPAAAEKLYPPAPSPADPSEAVAPRPADPKALLRHAEDADRAGQTGEAIRLYARVVGEFSATAPELAEFAQQRIAYLRHPGPHGPPPAPALSIAGEVVYGPTAGGPRFRPLEGEAPPPPAVRLAPPASEPGTAAAAPPASAKPQPTWTQPTEVTSRSAGAAGPVRQIAGRLRKAGRSVGDSRAFVLEPADGGVRYYVVPRAGVDLEALVGSDVELSGPAVYKGELKANYMDVVQARPLR